MACCIPLAIDTRPQPRNHWRPPGPHHSTDPAALLTLCCAVFFVEDSGERYYNASSALAAGCAGRQLAAYRVQRDAYSLNTSAGGTNLGIRNFKQFALSGTVRLGPYSNRVSWDNLWFSRFGVAEAASGADVLPLACLGTQGNRECSVAPRHETASLNYAANWDAPPDTTSFASYRLLAPADLSTASNKLQQGMLKCLLRAWLALHM